MLVDTIQKRRSVRSFKPDPIPEDVLLEIIKAGQYAPTANNSRGIEYVVIQDPNLKQKIYDISDPKQDFVKNAPVLLIPIVNTKKTRLPIQDLSLASQNIFLQATAMGIGSVWKNFFPPIAQKVHALLNLPPEYDLINAIPLGYPEKIPSPHGEEIFDLTCIHFENFTEAGTREVKRSS